MSNPWEVYDLLLDSLASDALVEEVVIGLTWTLCRTETVGLAMSPQGSSRTLQWPGTLRGRPVRELAAWLRQWDPWQAAVGMAAVNAALAPEPTLIHTAETISPQGPANLAVFQHFLPHLQGKRVVVVGRYPGLENGLDGVELTILERHPGPDDLPDPAAEYLLPEADWVFLTATSLINKTFPRLAELARDSNLVLMGPTTPWLAELAAFGVDYLAGVRVTDSDKLRDTVAEGGGTRIFDNGVQYCVADLGQKEMVQLKTAIADTVARREHLKLEMESWYTSHGSQRFPQRDELVQLDGKLSHLDSRYKRLWDARN